MVSLTLGLGMGLTPRKKISAENLKPNAKHEYRRRRLGKIVKSCGDEKFFIFEVTSS